MPKILQDGEGLLTREPGLYPPKDRELIAQVGDENFGVFAGCIGDAHGGQAGQGVNVTAVNIGVLRGHAGLGDQMQMAIGLVAKPQAVLAVGKQQFFAAQGGH